MIGAKNHSFVLFVVLLSVLSGASWFYTGHFAPPSSNGSIWFYGGLFALLTAKFVTEYRFTKPNDVIINCLATFVAISTLSQPPHAMWWELLRWSAFGIGAMALLLAWDPGREAKTSQGPVRTALFRLITRLGSADVLFSIVFVLALLSYLKFDHPGTRFFVILWGAILVAANLNLGAAFSAIIGKTAGNREIVGTVHSILSPSVVFCRKLNSAALSSHQIVGFARSGRGPVHCYGMVLDERPTASETLVAVALLSVSATDACLSDTCVMLKLSEGDLAATENLPIRADDASKIAGTVARGTNINQVRFELFGSPNIAAGTLLSVNMANGPVYYQTFQGVVREEETLRQSSRAFVEGEAEQVGVWNSTTRGFEAHDWVAKERSLVSVVDEDIAPPPFELGANQISVGKIPGSRYPVNVDLEDLVLFHTAILGVTGSGKSFLAYELIEKCAAKSIKVVCVDPTGDYQRHLNNAVMLQDGDALKAFLASTEVTIGIVETAQNQQPIKQTSNIAKTCLDWCIATRTDEEILAPKPKVLLVLEEAHLLVPEWNFNPVKSLQETVNVTSQIVLQARKFGLGFLVISQRTANVVKSVLNQCNTIVSFQAFDETGFDFLKNYMGPFHVQSLPNLKQRHGIVVGKASLSKRPIMARFNEQERHLTPEPLPVFLPPAPPAEELDGDA